MSVELFFNDKSNVFPILAQMGVLNNKWHRVTDRRFGGEHVEPAAHVTIRFPIGCAVSFVPFSSRIKQSAVELSNNSIVDL
ncbi:MAG: hypothetical protein ACI376_05065 [Candidatus Bruticola sp.]